MKFKSVFRTLSKIYDGAFLWEQWTTFSHKLFSQNTPSWMSELLLVSFDRSSPPEMFLGKVVLKICSKSTGERPCRSLISIKLLCNFIEITLRHGFSPVNLLHIFKTLFPKNSFGGLLLTWDFRFSYNGPLFFHNSYNWEKVCLQKLFSFIFPYALYLENITTR